MATMPRLPDLSQTTGPSQTDRSDWFASGPGRQLLESEAVAVQLALEERPGQPWLWLAPVLLASPVPDRGLHLRVTATGWSGPVRCGLPLPLANESVFAVVLQHAGQRGGHAATLLAECARVLVPGGQLLLFCLNPLSPYRWRWRGQPVQASEPMPWRRRMRVAGLQPDPVSQGLGPRWGVAVEPALQHGPGMRAAWLLRARKRVAPLTPVRLRAPLRIGDGVPAA
jgi:SAM-dependent methyltransferase